LLAALRGTPPFEVLLVDDFSRLSRDAAEILWLVRLLPGARAGSPAAAAEQHPPIS